MRNIEIAFMNKDLHSETYNFGKRIQEELGVKVVFIVDKDTNGYKSSENCIVYSVKDSVCIGSGYHNCMITGERKNTILQRNPCAYDKLLYYYNKVSVETPFVFVFEDDCFIPSLNAIQNLIDKYSEFDLVVPNNNYKSDNLMDWHWESIYKKIDAPRYYSMVCAMGFSRNLLNVIDAYVQKNNTLFFTEAMFNTLAMQNGLNVIDAFELKTIVWQGNWGLDEFLLLPNNIFHPMKDLDFFENYRAEFEKKRKSKYKPKNKLPNFIKELM